MGLLHLGCGKSKEPGAFGVDIREFTGVDLVHDLDTFPYPLSSDTYTKVIAIDVLEHLEHFVGAMEEIHRVAKNGAEVVITAPFATSLFRHHDPTHRRGLTRLSMDYFIVGTDFYKRYAYSNASYELIDFGYALNEKPGLIGRVMRKIANAWPAWYERHFCYLFPMDNVFFILKAVK